MSGRTALEIEMMQAQKLLGEAEMGGRGAGQNMVDGKEKEVPLEHSYLGLGYLHEAIEGADGISRPDGSKDGAK